jgi:hypothetical protein
VKFFDWVRVRDVSKKKRGGGCLRRMRPVSKEEFKRLKNY